MSNTEQFTVDFHNEIRNRIREQIRNQERELWYIRLTCFCTVSLLAFMTGGLLGYACYQFVLFGTDSNFKIEFAMVYSMIGGTVLSIIIICSLMFSIKFCR